MFDWIVVDWGMMWLCVWVMVGVDVFDSCSLDKGMGVFGLDQFEFVLLDLIGDWIVGWFFVIVCGMVGVCGGWVEVEYCVMFCVVLDLVCVIWFKVVDLWLDVYILLGLL